MTGEVRTTVDNLRRFCCGEYLFDTFKQRCEPKDYFDQIEQQEMEDPFEFIFEGFVIEGEYEVTFEEIISACKRFVEKDIPFTEILVNWYLPMEDYVAFDVGLEELRYQDGPENELIEDLFLAMEDEAGMLYFDEDNSMDTMTKAFFEPFLEEADNIVYNRGKDILERRYTKRQKKEFIKENQYDYKITHLNKKEQILFRNFLEELCADGDLEAIEIKGYAVYGSDHPIYECDWETSKKCFEYIMEHGSDEKKAQAANTLGYIFYYGRCNGGKPEYDKAYRVFSLAAFFGFYEAKYKVGDMLKSGLGIPKNQTAAFNLYADVYKETYDRFIHGDECYVLADAALRVGSAYLYGNGVGENATLAYYYYLIAQKVMEIRMKKHTFFGFKKVKNSIEEGIAQTRRNLDEIGIEYQNDEMLIQSTLLPEKFLCNDNIVHVEVKKSKDEWVLKIKVFDKNTNHRVKVLLTFPFMSYCEFKDTYELLCPKDVEIDFKDGNTKFKADQIDVDFDQGMTRFMYKGKRQMTIWSNGLIIRK